MTDRFHTTKKAISLDRAEKDAMKASITGMPVVSSYRWRTAPLRAVGTALFLIAFGAVTVAAERTIPGEYLYPIKIHVNEEVARVLSVTDESKVKYATRLIDRRLEEVDGILISSKLDVEGKTKALTAISGTTSTLHEDAMEKIEEMNDYGEEGEALALSAELEATLSSHADRLEDAITEGLAVIATLEELHEQIEQDEVLVGLSEDTIIDGLSGDAADAAHEVRVILDSIDEQYQEFESKARQVIDAQARAEAVAMHQYSVQLKEQADDRLREGGTIEALSLYAEALETVYKAVLLLEEQ